MKGMASIHRAAGRVLVRPAKGTSEEIRRKSTPTRPREEWLTFLAGAAIPEIAVEKGDSIHVVIAWRGMRLPPEIVRVTVTRACAEPLGTAVMLVAMGELDPRPHNPNPDALESLCAVLAQLGPAHADVPGEGKGTGLRLL